MAVLWLVDLALKSCFVIEGSSVCSKPARRRSPSASICAALLAIACLATPQHVYAADGTVTAITGQSCAGTRATTNLGCTANDFTSNVTFDQSSTNAITSCIAGTSIFVDVLATVDSGSPDRYDAAYFFGESGNSPQLNNAANMCSLGVFPTANDPFKTFDTDVCGDFRGNSPPATLLIQSVKLNCLPTTGTNQLAVPYTLVFNNQINGSTCTAANVTAASNAKCQGGTATLQSGGVAVSVNGYITVTKATNPAATAGTFAFTTSASPVATVTPSTFNLLDGASQTVQVPINGGSTRTLTVSETLLSGWDATTSITCTTPGGASAASYVTVNNAARTITANLTAANYGALCTITNSKLPTVTLTKVSNGGVGGFTFTGTNGWTSQTITTVTSGAAVTGATQTLTARSTATTITETIPAGYTLTSVTCTGLGAGGTYTPNLSTGAVAFDAAATAAGSNIACTFSNQRRPTVTLTKVSNGGVGGFTFTGNNGWSSQTITTVTSGTGVAGATQILTAASTATTIAESIPAGYAVASISCAGLGSGGTATPNLSTGAVAFDAAATAPDASITCTFTNTRLPTITLTKVSNGAVGPFTFTGDNGFGAAQTITTVTSGTGIAGAARTLSAASTVTTITETIPAGYVLASVTCTGTGGGTQPTVNTGTGAIVFTAAQTAPGSNIACTFTNTRLPTVTLTKVSNGGVGGFTFTGTNGWTSQTITTVTSGAGVAGTTQTLTAASTATTITEAIPANYLLASVTCTGTGGGTQPTVNTGTGAIDFTAAQTAPGSNIACTVTNNRLPTVTLTKVSTGGVGGFTFTGNNGWASQTITTAISGTGVTGATQTLTAAGTATTITEGALATFALTSVTCTGIAGANYSVNLGARSVTFNAAGTAAGSAIACTFSNQAVIDAVNDNFTGAPINGLSGGTTASVLGNDTDAGAAVTPASVTVSLTSNGGLTGLVINANGTLTVPAGTTAASYTATYQICSVAMPARCDTATVDIVISVLPPTGGTSCTGTNLANNGGTELPAVAAGANTNTLSMPGWSTTDPIGIEQWGTGFNGVPSHTGNQFIELNASVAGTLTQTTNAIQRRAQLDVYWAHRARVGTDTARLVIADNGGGSTNYGTFSTSTAAWVVRSATHVASTTGTSATLTFTSISTGSGNASVGNFLDTIEVCQTYMTVAKSEFARVDVDTSGTETAGDQVTYQYAIANPAGNNRSLASLVITDNKLGAVNIVTPLSGDANTNGFLDPGETWIVRASYTVIQSDIDTGSVTNIAYASGSTGANTIRTDNATVTVNFTRTPNLTVVKTANSTGPLTVGQVLTFSYLVTNTGNVTLTGVAIQETAFNGSGGTGAVAPAGGLTSLPPGATTTFTASYTVTQNDVDILQ